MADSRDPILRYTQPCICSKKNIAYVQKRTSLDRKGKWNVNRLGNLHLYTCTCMPFSCPQYYHTWHGSCSLDIVHTRTCTCTSFSLLVLVHQTFRVHTMHMYILMLCILHSQKETSCPPRREPLLRVCDIAPAPHSPAPDIDSPPFVCII